MRARDEHKLLADVGQRVREARLKAGITQEDAAGRANIDTRRWQRLEDGAVNPTVRTLGRAAEALGLTFWQLLDCT